MSRPYHSAIYRKKFRQTLSAGPSLPVNILLCYCKLRRPILSSRIIASSNGRHRPRLGLLELSRVPSTEWRARYSVLFNIRWAKLEMYRVPSVKAWRKCWNVPSESAELYRVPSSILGTFQVYSLETWKVPSTEYREERQSYARYSVLFKFVRPNLKSTECKVPTREDSFRLTLSIFRRYLNTFKTA